MQDKTQCEAVCDNEAEYDVVTIRGQYNLCEDCMKGQERAGVVEDAQELEA